MRSPLRFVVPAVAPFLLVLLSGCGARTSVGASPLLAGNWNFQTTLVPSAQGQIAHVGGAVMVSSGGAITGALHVLPATGQDASSLCYAMANQISVTGSMSADKTLVLTSSNFDGNVLTVLGTYVAGEGAVLPSLSHASLSITGPCGVAAQAVVAEQYPLLNGTYAGTATFGANLVPFSVTFSNATTPNPISTSGYSQYMVTSTAAFGADPCFASSSVKQVLNSLNGALGDGVYGNIFSAVYADPVTETGVTVSGVSTDPASDGISFSTITLRNPYPPYTQCNDAGTAVVYKQQ